MTTQRNKFVITATVFRNIFFILFILLFASSIVLAGLGARQLQTTANEVRGVVSAASSVDQTSNRTITLWNELQKNQVVADKATQIIAGTDSYAYQDVIVRDLNGFAEKAGIKIKNYDFTANTTNATTAPAPTDQTDSTASATAESAVTTTAAGAQLKTVTVNVSLESPVDYKRFLTFVHYIKQNLTKMQISKLSLSRATGQENSQSVTSDVLTIEVYVQ